MPTPTPPEPIEYPEPEDFIRTEDSLRAVREAQEEAQRLQRERIAQYDTGWANRRAADAIEYDASSFWNIAAEPLVTLPTPRITRISSPGSESEYSPVPVMYRCETCRQDVDDMHGRCMKCRQCCKCYVCTMCQATMGKVCRNCGRCAEGCCQCISCPNCMGRTIQLCPACNDCSRCCRRVLSQRCHYIEREELTFWTIPTVSKPIPRLPTKRYLSAEIEVADARSQAWEAPMPLDSLINFWKAGVVYDGSLGDRGFEINTAPAQGQLFIDQVTQLCKELNRFASTNDRCGCHIHVDARDFSDFEMKRLIYLYAAMEPILYTLVPYSRRDNRYCTMCARNLIRPILALDKAPKFDEVKEEIDIYYDKKVQRLTERTTTSRKTYADRLREALLTGVYGRTDIPFFREVKVTKGSGQSHHYRNLNLHSWFYRGTIELRMLEGTINANTIIGFASVVGSLMDTAFRMKDTEARSLYARCENLSINDRRVVFYNEILQTREQKDWARDRLTMWRDNG